MADIENCIRSKYKQMFGIISIFILRIKTIRIERSSSHVIVKQASTEISDHCTTQGDYCLECEDGYYFDSLSFKCEQCSSNCVKCWGDKDRCINCSMNDIIDLQSHTCVKCDITNCDKCVISFGEQKCTQCSKGFYKDISTNQCKECNLHIPGCNTCDLVYNSVTYIPTCTECQSGFGIVPVQSRDYYIAGCKKCTKCEKSCYFKENLDTSDEYCINKVCDSLLFDWDTKQCGTCDKNECIKCYTNQYTCNLCDKLYSLNINLQCSPCPQGCICNGSSLGCVDCEDGFYFTEEKCIACPPSCQDCVMNKNSIECLACAKGYYLDKIQSKCIKCSSACASCIDANKCTECMSGLKLNNMSCECQKFSTYFNGSECVDCNIECNGCVNTSSNCTKCSSASLVHIKDNEKCGILNAPKDYSFSCCKCIGSRFFNPINGMCDKCSTGCSECTQANVCDKCESSDLILNQDKSKCICKDLSSFYDQFKQSCTECSALCLKCTSLTECVTCVNSKLINKNGSCHCESGYFYNKFLNDCKQCDDECSECINQSNYCTTCKESNIIPYNGKCKCQEKNQVLNQEGECICAPNFYSHPLRGCIKMCQKISLVDKYKDELLKISKLPDVNLGSNKNIFFNVNLDDTECENTIDSINIRFIEWNFYDAESATDLKQGRVGEVGDMFVKLAQDTLNNLPLDKIITLKIKIILSISETINSIKSSQIIEATDSFNFTIVQSPIIVKLSGQNRAYGKNELIVIDASETYDPDIEGMHYYLPFIFKWECPSEIPTSECKEKFPLSGNKTYSLSFYSSLLIQYGLKFNQYYQFTAIASRLNKTQSMSFSIKLLNYESVPKIEVDQLSKSLLPTFQDTPSAGMTIVSEKYVMLRVKIASDILISKLSWYLETTNGMISSISSNSSEELIIEKEELVKLKISKIHAKVELPSLINEKGSALNSFSLESYYEYSFKPPTISGNLEPSLKISIQKKSKFYMLINIDIINANCLDSWIYPIIYDIVAIRKVDSNRNSNIEKESVIPHIQRFYLSEESVSRSIVKAIVGTDVVAIELKACTTLTKDCLTYFQNMTQILKVEEPIQIDIINIRNELIESADFSIGLHHTKINALIIAIELLHSNISYVFDSNIMNELLEKSASCFESKVLSPKAQSSLLIEIIRLISDILSSNYFEKYINSDELQVKEKFIKETILKYLPKIFIKESICNILKDFDIEREIIFTSINKLSSTLLKSANIVSSNALLTIDFIELAFYIIRIQENCIADSNLLSKTYIQTQNETIHLIKPFYYVQYNSDNNNPENKLCNECLQMNEVLSPIKSNTSYNIDFILAGFNKNNFKKQYTFINIIKNVLFDTKFVDLFNEQNSISLNSISMILSIDTLNDGSEYNKIVTKFMHIDIPLSELQFNFNSEISPIEFYACYSYNRYPTGLFSYFDSFVSKNRNKFTADIKSLVWEAQPCTNSYNSTHFSCSCTNTGLIAIRFKEENIYALKVFFLGVIFFTMLTVYCCSLVCTASTNDKKQYTLHKLQPIIHYNLTNFNGVFCVIFSTLHVLCCCRRNPIIGTQKSMSIFMLVVFSIFNICLLLLNLLTKTQVKEDNVYVGWNTTLSYKVFIPIATMFIFIMYEFLKSMFIKTPYLGMVKFRDEGEVTLEHKKEEIKEGEKINEELEGKVEPDKIKEQIASDCNQNVQTNPASTARDPNAISSQRQMKGQRNEEVRGVAGRYMIDVTKDYEDQKDNEYNAGDNEIVLAADEFEEPTRYNKAKVVIGLLTIILIGLLPFVTVAFNINSLNIYATFISLLYTLICIIIYMLIIQPSQILLMSCVFISKKKSCNFMQRFIITQECTLIVIKILKVQNVIEKERMIIQQNKIIQEEIETARKREEEIKLQNEIFGPHEKNYPYNPSDKYIVLKSASIPCSDSSQKYEQDSKGLSQEHSTSEFDISTAKIQRRKRHRNPTQTNKIYDQNS